LINNRILVIGGDGMLGGAFRRVLAGSALYTSSNGSIAGNKCDITDPSEIREVFDNIKPDVVINCAAYTAVDNAETKKLDAFNVNALGVGYLAEESKRINARFVHFSTDYVYGGQIAYGDKFLPFTEEDECKPCGVYGSSKYYGERLALSLNPKTLILRTSWLHGIGGKNFVETVLKIAEEKGEIKMVADQFGSPTWTNWLVKTTLRLIDKDAVGVVNSSSIGGITWLDFASEIVKIAKIDCRLFPISSTELNRPAPRPAYSVMSIQKLNGLLGSTELIDWKSGIEGHLRELGRL